jgi:hypothetical protein
MFKGFKNLSKFKLLRTPVLVFMGSKLVEAWNPVTSVPEQAH